MEIDILSIQKENKDTIFDIGAFRKKDASKISGTIYDIQGNSFNLWKCDDVTVETDHITVLVLELYTK